MTQPFAGVLRAQSLGSQKDLGSQMPCLRVGKKKTGMKGKLQEIEREGIGRAAVRACNGVQKVVDARP